MNIASNPPPRERRSLKAWIGPLVSVTLFAAALWLLRRELHAFHYRDLAAHLRSLSIPRLMGAAGLGALSYLALTFADKLAFVYIGKPMPWRRSALPSFISYVLANNVGNTLLAGGAMRLRLYSGLGLSTVEIAEVTVFCTATNWLGFFVIAGLALLIDAQSLAAAQPAGLGWLHALGILLTAAAISYVLAGVVRRAPLRLGGYELQLPGWRLSLPQILVSTADLACCGGLLFLLLPHQDGLAYPAFLGFYILALVAGIISQVPGGLGVFESLMVVFLKPGYPPAVILGALLAYRAMYYLAPLLAATALLGGMEVRRRREGAKKLAGALGRWVPFIVPHVLAITTFLGGVILLLSGATPPEKSRWGWLNDFLPLPVMEISHLLGSLAGVGLLLLARGLQRRIDAAYHLAFALLCAGAVFSMLKGLDYEEAFLLTAMAAALAASRDQFHRRSTLSAIRFSPGWIALIALAVLGAGWLGLFCFRNQVYSSELWWRFSIDAHAPRFLRASFVTAAALLLVAAYRLLSPAAARAPETHGGDAERALPIIARSPRSASCLALLGDKRFLFSGDEQAFIMYGVEGVSWIAMGDPVGPEEKWPELIWDFREQSDRHGAHTVFYQVETGNLHYYLDAGLTLLKLGEEARVPLGAFSMEGSARKGLRYTLKKTEREGGTFAIAPAAEIPALMPELRAVSDAWLEHKSAKEKGFSLGFFNDDYLKNFDCALLRHEGRVVAFANIWQSAGKEELSIDLIRYSSDAPPGAMEYLMTRILLWGKEQGWKWFNLGMAPLSGLASRPLAPLWNRLGQQVFLHGEHFYNFQGLREFKEKFDPVWAPKYLASSGKLALPRILLDIAALIGGGLRGALKR